jgi:hypothetical protein
MWSLLIHDIFRSQFSDALDAKLELMEFFTEHDKNLWWHNSNLRTDEAEETCLIIWGMLFATTFISNVSITYKTTLLSNVVIFDAS